MNLQKGPHDANVHRGRQIFVPISNSYLISAPGLATIDTVEDTVPESCVCVFAS